MSFFVSALEAEIASLQDELEADPRFLKLRELERVRALYGAQEQSLSLRIEKRVIPVAKRRMPSPERQKILDAAKEAIRGRTQPTPTSDIFDAISPDVEIPGNAPKNNLSAMLSNSTEFVSHGRAGWTLASETSEASGDLLARSAPEASNSSPASPAGEPDSLRPVDPVPGGGT
jgi:hypothetical protein